MEEKADNIPANALDALKAVVPNELVSKLIGKSGNVIKRIQSESGARTVFQTEEEMIQTTYFYGRTVTITGTVRQRCHALYLIYRQMNGPQLGVNPASIGSGAGVGNGWGAPNNQMNSYMHIQSQQQHPQHQYSQQQNSRQKSTMHHHQPNQQPGYGKEASGPPIGPPPYGAQS
eukprot:gene3612-4494_t